MWKVTYNKLSELHKMETKNSHSKNVSIIIPAYKAEKTIIKTVRSSLIQGQVIGEVIVVIDGDLDNTQEVLQEIKDPRLKVFVFKNNKGAQAARNKGLSEAIGDYIVFLDSDDYFEAGFIEHLFISMTQDESCNICFGSMRVLDNKGVDFLVEVPKYISWEDVLVSRLLSVGIVGIHSILWKREFVESIGGLNPDVVRNQDGELVIRALLNTKNFKVVNGKSAVYFQYDCNDRVSRRRSVESFQSQKTILNQVEDYFFINSSESSEKINAALSFFCINKCLGLAREGYFGKEYSFWRDNVKWSAAFFVTLKKEKLVQSVLYFLFRKNAYKAIDFIKKLKVS